MRDFGTLFVVGVASAFGGVAGLINWSDQGDPLFFWFSIFQLWASGALIAYGLARFSRWKTDAAETRNAMASPEVAEH
jgi:hypothetical protein